MCPKLISVSHRLNIYSIYGVDPTNGTECIILVEFQIDFYFKLHFRNSNKYKDKKESFTNACLLMFVGVFQGLLALFPLSQSIQ